MAVYDAIARAIEDPTQTVSLKIAPMAPSASTPSTSGGSPSGGGGGSAGVPVSAGLPSNDPTSPNYVPVGFGVGGASVTKPTQQLTKNPQLAETPGGAYTDAQYEADLAAARQQFTSQYLNVLQQLGFMGEDGKFIPGRVETEAARQRANLQADENAALAATIGDVQRNGATFSGRNAYRQSEAVRPFTQQIAQVEEQLPLQLGDLTQQANDLVRGFNITMQQLLAAAAQRKAALIEANPAPGPPAPTPPPPAPNPPLSNSNLASYLFDPTFGSAGAGLVGLPPAAPAPPPENDPNSMAAMFRRLNRLGL